MCSSEYASGYSMPAAAQLPVSPSPRDEDKVDRLLGENECEQAAVDRNYEKRRASRNKTVNEQRAVK